MYLVFYSSAYGLAHFCERGTISLIINVKSTAISVDYNSLHPTEEDKKKKLFFPPLSCSTCHPFDVNAALVSFAQRSQPPPNQ